MPTLEIENAELFYTDSGGDKPPVVFSHGFGMDRTMFDAQVAALSPHYRVISWDQRSWGSSIAKGPFNLWDSAKDLWLILDQLDIERAVLVGMSQGGFVSIRATLLEPNRVNALVLIGSQAGVEARAETDEMILTWLNSGASRIHRKLADAILGPGDWPIWYAKWDATDLRQLPWAYSCLIDREDVTRYLRQINCPALIIHGMDDRSIDPQKARIMKQELGGASTLVEIEGGTHAVNISHSERVNHEILNFLLSIALKGSESA
jgi:3-oxoadipate enol-lactonase